MDSLLKYIFKEGKFPVSYASRLVILGVDLASALLSYYAALLIIHGFDYYEAAQRVGPEILLLLGLRAISFVLLKTYLIVVRYLGERDYKNIFLAIAGSSLAFGLSLELFPTLLPLPEAWAIVVIDFGVLLCLAAGFRIMIRLLIDKLHQLNGDRDNIAIFGAGELGAMIAQVLKRSEDHNYRLAAFFDDNPKLHLHSLNGVRIFNPGKEFNNVIRRYNIKKVVIGINGLPDDRRRSFVEQCLNKQLKVLKIPPAEDWINNSLKVGHLTNLRLEDLLNRPPIKLDSMEVQRSIQGKVVLVTGCAGSIGSEIVRQLLRYGPELLIGVDQAETPMAELSIVLEKQILSGQFQPIMGDIRDYDKMQYLFRHYRPDYVFHAAAYKHVPIMEVFPDEAIKTNIMGTRFIADLASRYGVRKFVMISSDKVVNPSNVMGASKRIAEIYVQSLNYVPYNSTQFITTRFGNVLGSNGSVIPIFKRQIAKKGPVTITHPDIKRFFMTIPEACQLVLEAGVMGNGGEIFVFDMGEPVLITSLAEKMIQLAGYRPNKDIEIVYTGLRPGEKLYEELLDKDENTIPTHHPKIYKAGVRPYDFNHVTSLIDTLIDMACTHNTDTFEIVKLMKTIVPEFASQNSAFSELD